MKTRVLLVAAVLGCLGAGVPGRAAPSRTICTWGGTPAAPTGTFMLDPGLNLTPAVVPLKFIAQGALGGDCHGRLVFAGQFDPGATCAHATFSGVTRGLPGVAEFYGIGTLVAPSRLLDNKGDLVALELPQILTGAGSGSEATDCATPEGFTDGSFSSTIVFLP
jgi:hypothetical protein